MQCAGGCIRRPLAHDSHFHACRLRSVLKRTRGHHGCQAFWVMGDRDKKESALFMKHRMLRGIRTIRVSASCLAESSRDADSGSATAATQFKNMPRAIGSIILCPGSMVSSMVDRRMLRLMRSLGRRLPRSIRFSLSPPSSTTTATWSSLILDLPTLDGIGKGEPSTAGSMSSPIFEFVQRQPTGERRWRTTQLTNALCRKSSHLMTLCIKFAAGTHATEMKFASLDRRRR